MGKISVYERVNDKLLSFAVIIAKKDGKWIFCRHKQRSTYEFPGGHREAGESILGAAERELKEETGAIDFKIAPVCAYSVIDGDDMNAEETFGMLFYADIKTLEDELHYEIEEIIITHELADHWTYPLIQPELLKAAAQRGFC